MYAISLNSYDWDWSESEGKKPKSTPFYRIRGSGFFLLFTKLKQSIEHIYAVHTKCSEAFRGISMGNSLDVNESFFKLWHLHEKAVENTWKNISKVAIKKSRSSQNTT